VLVLLFSMFYARSTTRMQSKQRPTARQLAVPYNPAYTDVRPKDIYRIRHVLGGDQSMPEGSEQRIHCVFRLHPHFAVAICWRRTLILLAYAALTAWLSLTTDFEKKVPAWIIVGILLVLGFRTYLRWLLWRDFFFVLTDQNIILARIHSPWFWWLKGRSPYLPVKSVNFVELDESRLGNAFDYGTLVIDGLSKLDVAYNRLKFVRRHDAIGKLVLAVVNANKAETA
jgi:hypothetical protein